MPPFLNLWRRLRPPEPRTSCVLAALAQARGHCSCLSSVGQSICSLVAFLRAAAVGAVLGHSTPQRREVLASPSPLISKVRRFSKSVVDNIAVQAGELRSVPGTGYLRYLSTYSARPFARQLTDEGRRRLVMGTMGTSYSGDLEFFIPLSYCY